jgi:hypothetical protein
MRRGDGETRVRGKARASRQPNRLGSGGLAVGDSPILSSPSLLPDEPRGRRYENHSQFWNVKDLEVLKSYWFVFLSFSWAQLSQALDKLSRDADIAVWRTGDGDYRVIAHAAAK